PAPPSIYRLSLHDALPICRCTKRVETAPGRANGGLGVARGTTRGVSLGPAVFRPPHHLEERATDEGETLLVCRDAERRPHRIEEDRKSTRLNSSHGSSSYA